MRARRMSNTGVARVSDDFYPRDPASSHPHVAACAYNSVFMSVLVQVGACAFIPIRMLAHLQCFD